jgi:hypothetical protein
MVPDGVRELIRARIAKGRLPCSHTIELWCGVSAGQRCDGCGVPIIVNDQMYLLCGEDWRLFRFHLECFQIWDAARNVGADVQQTA